MNDSSESTSPSPEDLLLVQAQELSGLIMVAFYRTAHSVIITITIKVFAIYRSTIAVTLDNLIPRFFSEKLRFLYRQKRMPLQWLHAKSYFQLQITFKEIWSFVYFISQSMKSVHKIAATYKLDTIHHNLTQVKKSLAKG